MSQQKQNHNSRPAYHASAVVAPRNDNVSALAYERRYSQQDLDQLAAEAGKVLSTPDEDVGVFATDPYRCMAAVRTALCLLGRRAVRAVNNGTGPGSAWAAFDDLAHIARTLGVPAESEQQQQRNDGKTPTLAAVLGADRLADLRGKLPKAVTA
jgi:hypothetical protein